MVFQTPMGPCLQPQNVVLGPDVHVSCVTYERSCSHTLKLKPLMIKNTTGQPPPENKKRSIDLHLLFEYAMYLVTDGLWI